MPNTHVPAAGEAMPAANVSRRIALLGGLSAAAALAVIPKVHAAPADHPDAELFRLERDLEAAHARREKASEVNCRIAAEIAASLPPRPLHPSDWHSPSMPAELREMHDAALQTATFAEVAKYDTWKPEPVRAWHEAVGRERDEVKATWEEWAALSNERHRERDYDALEDHHTALLDEGWDIGMRICKVPAQSLEGMMVKIRVSDLLTLEDFGDANEAFASIAADIRRLAVAGQAVA